eukprot:IDg7212t1
MATLMMHVDNFGYVLVPGTLLLGRSDNEPRWYRRLADDDETDASLDCRDIKPRRLGELYLGFKGFEEPFYNATAADWAEYEHRITRERDQKDVSGDPKEAHPVATQLFEDLPIAKGDAGSIGLDDPLRRLERSYFTNAGAYQ